MNPSLVSESPSSRGIIEVCPQTNRITKVVHPPPTVGYYGGGAILSLNHQPLPTQIRLGHFRIFLKDMSILSNSNVLKSEG